MRSLRTFLTLLCVVIAVVASAIEPSNIVVNLNGKEYYKHRVESGQTLYALAKAYGVTEQQIIDSNVGLTASSLRADDYILIPRTKSKTYGSERKVSLDADKQEGESKLSKRFLIHEVKAGDTLYSIARKYKISLQILEVDNPEIELDKLAIGDQIKIRRADRGYATTAEIEQELKDRNIATNAVVEEVVNQGVETEWQEHTVAIGETIYSLSRAYGVSEEELMKLNNLQTTADLKAGMVIRIKPLQEPQAVEVVEAVVDAVAEEETPQEARRKERERGRQEGDAKDESDEGLIDVGMSADSLHPVDIFEGEAQSDIVPIEVEFPPLSMHHTLKVALMLPFHINNKVNPYFVDFYNGMLLAMEDLKSEGYDIELSVFDTYSSIDRIIDLVSYEEGVLDAQLIIGPVYEDELRHVVGMAEQNEIPVVSPLADNESIKSPVLFQMHAEPECKYDRFTSLFDASKEIVTIYANASDKDFVAEIEQLVESPTRTNLNFVFDRGAFFYNRRADGSNGEEVDITEFMRTPTHKTFIIASANETDVDRILTTLASTRLAIVARSINFGDYVVVGNRKWKQSNNIDKQSFFRNNIIFFSPYFASRSNEEVRLFDGRYVKAYNALPSMYSYRGYDAAMIFCRKMFTGIDGTILEEYFTPLSTTYRFEFKDGIYQNCHWTGEQYNSNFTITAK